MSSVSDFVMSERAMPTLKRVACSSFVFLVSLFALLLAGPAFADYGVNMPVGVTEISRRAYDLHMFMLWLCIFLSLIVYGVMVYSLINHRKSKGAVAAQFSHSTKAEIIWTVIPILILVALAFPATKAFLFIEDASDSEMTVKAVGYQWKWKYEYLDQGVSFFSTLSKESQYQSFFEKLDPKEGAAKISTLPDDYLLDVDNPLVLPINKKIRVLTTADDVIHSWWVPDFGWKRDAIPGFVTESWVNIEKAGVYRGKCAELCGKGHGYMPIVVKAVEEDEYNAWLDEMRAVAASEATASQKAYSAQELITKGEKVYDVNCAVCHGPTGAGNPPTFPALINGVVTVGPIEEHINRVLHGKGLMAAFKEQLNDIDVAAVVSFERNAWGNADRIKDNGEQSIAQPADVAKQR